MIRIFIESGIAAAAKKGKKTTNEADFVEKVITHYFPKAVVSSDFEVVGVIRFHILTAFQIVMSNPAVNIATKYTLR